MRLTTLFWAGFWAFLIDQITKYLVIHWMELSRVRSIDVLDPTSELGRFEDKVRRQEALAAGKQELAASSIDAQFEALGGFFSFCSTIVGEDGEGRPG